MNENITTVQSVTPKFLKPYDMAKMLGISKSTFYRLFTTDTTFPKPLQVTESLKLYDVESVTSWIKAKSSQSASNDKE